MTPRGNVDPVCFSVFLIVVYSSLQVAVHLALRATVENGLTMRINQWLLLKVMQTQVTLPAAPNMQTFPNLINRLCETS